MGALLTATPDSETDIGHMLLGVEQRVWGKNQLGSLIRAVVSLFVSGSEKVCTKYNRIVVKVVRPS